MNKWLNRFVKKLNLFSKSIKRFPESVILTSTITILMILLVEDVLNRTTIGEIVMSLILAFFLTLGNTLLYERINPPRKTMYRVVSNLIIVSLCSVFYLTIPEIKTTSFITFYTSLVFILFFVFTLVPYYQKKKNYSYYVVRLSLNIILSFFYSLVLFAGVSGLVFAIETLFELSFTDTIYVDVLLIALGIFGVIYYISTIEATSNKDLSVTYYPKSIKILLTVIILPLTVAYTLVLYAYFVRILVTFTWPNQIVSHLVIWYGLIAFFTLFALETLTNLSRWILLLRRWFFTIFLLPTIMLIISISIRINQYGLTFQRYYVLIIGIWFSGIIFYHFISLLLKKHHTQVPGAFYVILGIILLLFSSIGPLSAVNLSVQSQKTRLSAILTEENMLENDILSPRSDLSSKTEEHITSIITYLEDMDQLHKLSYLPSDFKPFQDMYTTFGFNYSYYRHIYDSYYNYFVPERKSSYIQDGYFLTFNHYDNNDGTFDVGTYNITISPQTITITNAANQSQLIVELSQVANNLSNTFYDKSQLTQDELTFTYQLEDEHTFRLVLYSISFTQKENAYHMNHMEGTFIISN